MRWLRSYNALNKNLSSQCAILTSILLHQFSVDHSAFSLNLLPTSSIIFFLCFLGKNYSMLPEKLRWLEVQAKTNLPRMVKKKKNLYTWLLLLLYFRLAQLSYARCALYIYDDVFVFFSDFYI